MADCPLAKARAAHAAVHGREALLEDVARWGS